jgi:hypothetical protein
MNDTYIVAAYVIIDDLLQIMNHNDDVRTNVSAAEIMIVAVVSSRYFQNNHERALYIMRHLGYVSKISISRFNRRLHALAEVSWYLLTMIGELLSKGSIFAIDSMPLPVCKRVRAQRCRKVKEKRFWGYCAAKEDYYFGWQLHLICDTQGVPVAFEMLPASWHGLVPLQEMLALLPSGSQVVADKGYVSQKDEIICYHYGNVRLIPRYRKGMRISNTKAELQLINKHRPMIETVNSQLEKMGIQRPHARTNHGFAIKVLTSLIALAFNNIL